MYGLTKTTNASGAGIYLSFGTVEYNHGISSDFSPYIMNTCRIIMTDQGTGASEMLMKQDCFLALLLYIKCHPHNLDILYGIWSFENPNILVDI